MTARHLDAAFRIDRATDQIDWIVSSLPTDAPQLTGAPRLEIVNDPLGGPRRPHHARLVGDILTMLDNRADTGQPSRAVAYRIDEVAETATLLWSIEAPNGQNGPVLGSVDVDVDGSVVVDWGSQQPLIQEFDPDHELLMQIRQDPNGALYRVIKEPKSTWSVGQLRGAAGGSVEAP